LHGFAAAHGLQGLAAAQGLHGFAAAHGLQGLQGLAAPQGLHGLQGLAAILRKFLCTSTVPYRVSAANSGESQGSVSAAMGASMQNWIISSSATLSTPDMRCGISTRCG
jgi:hypothetical protein